MIKHWTWLLLALLCTACSYSGEWTEVKRANFSMSMPDFAYEMEGLNPDASLQYGSKFRNFYLVVLEESPDNTPIKSYYNKTKTDLLALLKNPMEHDSTFRKIDGKDAYHLKLSGIVGQGEIEERIHYDLVFLQGEKSIYQICNWKWMSWREKYEADTEKMLNSFREL